MAYLERSDGNTTLLHPLPADESDAGQLIMDGDGKRYARIIDLLNAYPELGEAQHLSLCCALVLHFHPGPGCVVIDDAEEYRTRYARLLLHGSESELPSTADFGPFDVSSVTPPQRRDGSLVFYAEDALYSVPYRVETAWPPTPDAGAIFQLLPLQE